MTKSATNGQTDKPISKMEAVRRTLTELGQDAKPLAIQSHVKSKFGLDMDTSVISAYKTTLKAVKKPAKAATAPADKAPKAPAPKTDSGISMDDILAFKGLTDRIGADR